MQGFYQMNRNNAYKKRCFDWFFDAQSLHNITRFTYFQEEENVNLFYASHIVYLMKKKEFKKIVCLEYYNGHWTGIERPIELEPMWA